MSTIHAVTLILVTLLVINSSGLVDGSFKKTDLNVGYLTAIKGLLKDRQGLAISGAMTMALGKFSNDEVFFLLGNLEKKNLNF